MAPCHDEPYLLAPGDEGGAVTRTARVRWATPAPEPQVVVTLLGTFSLDVDGATVSLPTSAQRLVGILAMSGRLGRSRLAGMLWPDASEQRALASLRTGIWRVNQAAPGLVATDHGTVSLGLSPRIDLHELVDRSHAVLEDPGAALAAGPASTEEHGDLLPDWDDVWIEDARERLSQLRLHVMEAEARWYGREGRFGLALDLALAAVQADDLRESAHRLVVEIHLAEGNVADAWRAFEHCREVLGVELGIEPSDAMRDLLPGRVGAPSPGTSAPLAQHRPHRAPRPLRASGVR